MAGEGSDGRAVDDAFLLGFLLNMPVLQLCQDHVAQLGGPLKAGQHQGGGLCDRPVKEVDPIGRLPQHR